MILACASAKPSSKRWAFASKGQRLAHGRVARQCNLRESFSMQLESFEKLANKQGLVPMLITQPFAPYGVDAIAGFPPEVAARLFGRKAAIPVGADGQPIYIAADTPEEEPAPASPVVAIPDDWESLHHLQRIRLAKELTGIEQPFTAAAADEVIRAEIQRRSE
jgi:hypothetical protein